MKTPVFAIVVHGSAATSDSHQSAQDFIQATVDLGHKVNSVFFYGDASAISIKIKHNQETGFLVQQNWLKLSQQLEIPLQSCISTSIKRGVVDLQQANETGEPVNLVDGFELVGLGALAESIHSNFKLIEFGT
jgi:tRNA 2-thiouridine synthesizing protein D